MRSRISADCMILTNSACSRVTLGIGDLAGASAPYQVLASYPGTPLSAIVGNSGAAAVRFNVVTASPRRRLDLICCSTEGAVANPTTVSPPTRLVTAAPPPLYGTCVRLTPAMLLKSSAARCAELPLPDDA